MSSLSLSYITGKESDEELLLKIKAILRQIETHDGSPWGETEEVFNTIAEVVKRQYNIRSDIARARYPEMKTMWSRLEEIDDAEFLAKTKVKNDTYALQLALDAQGLSHRLEISKGVKAERKRIVSSGAGGKFELIEAVTQEAIDQANDDAKILEDQLKLTYALLVRDINAKMALMFSDPKKEEYKDRTIFYERSTVDLEKIVQDLTKTVHTVTETAVVNESPWQ